MVRRLLTVDDFSNATSFERSEDGWVFLRRGNSSGILLDGKKLADISPVPGQFEALVFVTAGSHTVAPDGTAGGSLFINAVPEIIAYNHPHKGLDIRLGGEFLKKYLYSSLTTINHGSLYNVHPQDKPKALAHGKAWMGYFGLGYRILKPLPTPQELSEIIQDHYFMNDDGFSGLTYDEIDIDHPGHKQVYTEAIRLLQDNPRLIYTFSSGVKFQINAQNADYLSAAVNVSQGRGKFLFECYARTQPTPEAADAYLEDYLVDTMHRANTLYPGVAPHSIIFHALYSRPGSYCTDTFPAVDSKVFHDKYFHILATRDEFRGLHGIGIYDYNRSGDEEDVRWVSRLLRHYFLEGNTEPVAPKFSYQYLPGILKNGNFAEKGKYWTLYSSDTKKPEIQTRKGYSQFMRLRYTQASVEGDNLCVFYTKKGRINSLSQTLRNLHPGKTYSLSFVMADDKEVKANKGAGKVPPIQVRLSDSKIVTNEMPLAKYFSENSFSDNKAFSRKIVIFKPEKSEVQLSITDEGNTEEEEKMFLINFIRVKPYYEE